MRVFIDKENNLLWKGFAFDDDFKKEVNQEYTKYQEILNP